MKFVPCKTLTSEEIKELLSGYNILQKDDPTADLTVCLCGSAYKFLWILSCVAIALAREYLENLESQLEKDIILETFRETETGNIVTFALLNLGVELKMGLGLYNEEKEKETIEKGLPPEKILKLVQCFFDKIIDHVNTIMGSRKRFFCFGDIV